MRNWPLYSTCEDLCMTHLLYRTPWSSQQCVSRSERLKKESARPRLVRGCTVGKEMGFACRLKRMSEHPNRINRPAVST